MKAEEANNIAVDFCKDEINRIMEMIEQVANNGYTELITKDDIKQGTKSFLLAEGYEIVTNAIQCDGFKERIISIAIKWDKR